METEPFDRRIEAAIEVLRQADAVLIGAGAGMSVDSGIPAYRKNPAIEKLAQKKAHTTPQNVGLFRFSPRQAWATAAERLALFRHTKPHEGYAIVRRWAHSLPGGLFVLTSNVDGQFAGAGFDPTRIFEGHGSVHHLQCVQPCCQKVWSAIDVNVEVDVHSGYAKGALPTCPYCGAVARPNAFFFGDAHFVETRAKQQAARYAQWLLNLRNHQYKLVVLECGAGTVVPTIRQKCAYLAREYGAKLIRINLLQPDEGEEVDIVLPMGALEACKALEKSRLGRA